MPAMKIRIDRTHIANAIKGDASHCMIAESIREKFPQARWVLVDMQSIRWTDRVQGKRYKYLTPRLAQHALLKFDRGEPVQPFSIGLSAPIVRAIHPLTHRAVKKPSKAKGKKPNTARYKHKKIASEAATVRKFGLRGLVE
jgi:hypothetical protein